MILDEPTSALDVATEAVVWRNVEELLQGKTAIMIAHRLSTARRADRIVVLERGEIVEPGTPRGAARARRRLRAAVEGAGEHRPGPRSRAE